MVLSSLLIFDGNVQLRVRVNGLVASCLAVLRSPRFIHRRQYWSHPSLPQPMTKQRLEEQQRFVQERPRMSAGLDLLFGIVDKGEASSGRGPTPATRTTGTGYVLVILAMPSIGFKGVFHDSRRISDTSDSAVTCRFINVGVKRQRRQVEAPSMQFVSFCKGAVVML